MSLRKLLENEFGIKITDTLPVTDVKVKKFLAKVEERGTSDNVVNNIQRYGFKGKEDKQAVLSYLGGVSARVLGIVDVSIK